MRKLLLASTLAMMSSAAFADHCNVNVDGNLELKNRVITVTTESDQKITIDSDYRIYVEGDELSLTSEQYQWVKTYYDGINSAAPQVAQLAIEGIAIANEAVGLVFGELLGSDSDAVYELSQKLDSLSEEINTNFYAADGSIQFSTQSLEDGDMFGSQWESEFEQAIEEAVMSSMGRLMIAIGTEMLFSGGDPEAFESRMEDFGENIEREMEMRGEAIEAKAEALCISLIEVDYAENQLQSEVAELAELDILNVRDDHNAM